MEHNRMLGIPLRIPLNQTFNNIDLDILIRKAEEKKNYNKVSIKFVDNGFMKLRLLKLPFELGEHTLNKKLEIAFPSTKLHLNIEKLLLRHRHTNAH